MNSQALTKIDFSVVLFDLRYLLYLEILVRGIKRKNLNVVSSPMSKMVYVGWEETNPIFTKGYTLSCSGHQVQVVSVG